MIKNYELGEKDVHMCGNHVAVVWDITKAERSGSEDKQNHENEKIRIRTGKPYIAFTTIRKTSAGKFEEDSAAPVKGTASLEIACEIMQDLWDAIAHLNDTQKLEGERQA